MTKTTRLLFTAALVGIALHGPPAQAQLARTFVSAAGGNDANDCNRTTPCRTFAEAHNKTLANGEITVLDPGGYGTVTITKTISIINDGVGEAGMLVSGGGTGITITAGASDAVSLRGITIKGIGFGGGTGITFNTGRSLTIENCSIRNLDGGNGGAGIVFRPTGPSSLAVSNTFIADNSGSGILVRPSGSGTVTAAFTRVELHNNNGNGVDLTGISSTGTINATVTDSVAANHRNGTGFLVSSLSAPTNLMVIRSVAVNNASGLGAFGISTLRVSQSTIMGNATSWVATFAGVLHSYGDNNIDGNGDGNPAPPTIVKK